MNLTSTAALSTQSTKQFQGPNDRHRKRQPITTVTTHLDAMTAQYTPSSLRPPYIPALRCHHSPGHHNSPVHSLLSPSPLHTCPPLSSLTWTRWQPSTLPPLSVPLTCPPSVVITHLDMITAQYTPSSPLRPPYIPALRCHHSPGHDDSPVHSLISSPSPTHSRPPLSGNGSSHDRSLVTMPRPHVTEHGPHDDHDLHPPGTTTATGELLATRPWPISERLLVSKCRKPS